MKCCTPVRHRSHKRARPSVSRVSPRCNVFLEHLPRPVKAMQTDEHASVPPVPTPRQEESPHARGLRRRAVSTENLVQAVRLVRSESQKHLVQHALMIASGAPGASPRARRDAVPAPEFTHIRAVHRRTPTQHRVLRRRCRLKPAVSGALRAEAWRSFWRQSDWCWVLTPPPRSRAQIVSAAYWSYGWVWTSALFCVVTCCSLFADR